MTMALPQWHERLTKLAEAKDLRWLITDQPTDLDKDAHEDGLSPEEYLEEVVDEAWRNCD